MRSKLDKYVSQEKRINYIDQLREISKFVSINGTILGCRELAVEEVSEFGTTVCKPRSIFLLGTSKNWRVFPLECPLTIRKPVVKRVCRFQQTA